MMTNLFMILGVILFLLGVIGFISNRKHLLSMLLSLEYMVLNLFFLLFVYLSMFDYGGYFSMIFLTFSVCEGALGLSILVSMIRTHGNDYFQSFSVLQC
uniref:NADH-ubiquinone oxidoreductase chain 4L n=1 Tax=Prosthiochaeta sp. CAU WL-2019511 TaxID=2813900 RepID=A0A895KW62_9MUSC|nr:NADH dehydrogenase subunit 4L [Prosthiochaeta sp. CAU WL-2019511]